MQNEEINRYQGGTGSDASTPKIKNERFSELGSKSNLESQKDYPTWGDITTLVVYSI